MESEENQNQALNDQSKPEIGLADTLLLKLRIPDLQTRQAVNALFVRELILIFLQKQLLNDQDTSRLFTTAQNWLSATCADLESDETAPKDFLAQYVEMVSFAGNEQIQRFQDYISKNR